MPIRPFLASRAFEPELILQPSLAREALTEIARYNVSRSTIWRRDRAAFTA
jgi:hypothetical protein